MSLKVAIADKRKGTHTTHVKYRVLVPVGEEIEAYLKIPDKFCYLVAQEIHDVPSGYFLHQCIKDDMEILPETLIEGDSMIITYVQPVLVENYWKGWVKNVSDKYAPPGEDAIFKLRIPLLKLRRSYVEEVRKEVELEEELKYTYYEMLRRLSPEKKIEFFMKRPELAVVTAI